MNIIISSVIIRKIACIGPLAFDRDKTEEDVYHSYGNGDERIIEVRQTLSSGSLVPKRLLFKLVEWKRIYSLT